jgi:predicted branched-subunit amino acid permease
MPLDESALSGQDTASTTDALLLGLRAASRSVFSYTLVGTFLGFGALCHDLGFHVLWSLLATVLIFAGPAQVILVTTLGAGGGWLQAAIAVTLSAIRLLPMTVSLLPMLKTSRSRFGPLLLCAHFIAVSLWVEVLRLAPGVPREQRVVFAIGMGIGMTLSSAIGTLAGFAMASQFPPLLAAALLFLTPVMFMVSTIHNGRAASDQIAFVAGIVLTPLFTVAKISFGLLIASAIAGTLGFAVHRLQKARA